jgi:hypothetical protein
MPPNLPIFSPEQLQTIEAAFEATWALISSDPFRDPNNDERSKMAIRKKLISVASSGVFDVDLMRKIALSSMGYSRV